MGGDAELQRDPNTAQGSARSELAWSSNVKSLKSWLAGNVQSSVQVRDLFE